MKPVIFIWLLSILLTPLSVVGDCFGEPEMNSDLTCRDQYFDCESCVIQTLLPTSCRGWCSQTGICAGGIDNITPILCADGEVVYEDFCPVDPSNPAFENQDCIFVSYEWHFCTQLVNGVGSCNSNYATNYCEIREQMLSVQLCNGESIEVVNPDYPFGGLALGYFKKNPAAVLVKFGPGQGLYTSGCFRFNYDPVSDVYLCANEDSYVMKYSLALEGQPVAPVPLPTNPPVAPPVALPTNVAPPVALPTNPPVASPVALPTNLPFAEPVSLPTTAAPSDSLITPTVPTSTPLSNPPQATDQTLAPLNAPVTPPVGVPTRLPTQTPNSSACFAGLGRVKSVFFFLLAWFVM